MPSGQGQDLTGRPGEQTLGLRVRICTWRPEGVGAATGGRRGEVSAEGGDRTAELPLSWKPTGRPGVSSVSGALGSTGPSPGGTGRSSVHRDSPLRSARKSP